MELSWIFIYWCCRFLSNFTKITDVFLLIFKEILKKLSQKIDTVTKNILLEIYDWNQPTVAKPYIVS